jgi:hypothetical protein
LVVGGAALDVVGLGALVLGLVGRGAVVVGVTVAPVWGLAVVWVGVVVPGLVLAPGVLVPGTVAPGTLVAGVVVPGVLAPGTVVVGVLVPGTVAPGVAAPGVVVVAVGIVATGGVSTVLVTASVVELEESPTSLTTAAASTPRDSAVITASVTIGAFQVGDPARRVRAAAPQRKHHSCSGCSGAPHSGHVSLTDGGAAVVAGAGGAETLTRPGGGDERSP